MRKGALNGGFFREGSLIDKGAEKRVWACQKLESFEFGLHERRLNRKEGLLQTWSSERGLIKYCLRRSEDGRKSSTSAASLIWIRWT